MELAVVCCGGTAPSGTDRLARRLASERWAKVCADSRGWTLACQIADYLDTAVTLVDTLDPEVVIDRWPGQRVLAVCDAPTIQSLVASTLDVAVEGIPRPPDSALTRIRASRSGTRSLICLNDTLHLTGVERFAPAAQLDLKGDESA
jgi:hypothetical protein